MSINPQVALIVSFSIRIWIVLNSSALEGRVRRLRAINPDRPKEMQLE